MPLENWLLFGQPILPPALAVGVVLTTFIVLQYWWERRRRLGFRRSLENSLSKPPAQPSAGGRAPKASSGNLVPPVSGGTVNQESEAFPRFGRFCFDHFGGYGLAVLFVGLALMVRLLLAPVLEHHLAFGFFLLAVITTGVFAHIWETLLALVLGYLAAAWFFVQPAGFEIGGADGWMGAALYFVTGLGIIWFMESEHKAWLRTLERDIAYVDRLKDLDRERAAHKQADGCELLASIVESAQDVILSVTREGRIVTWNAAAERLLGYSAREAIGQPLALIVPPEHHAEQQRILKQVNHGERTWEWHAALSCKGGSTTEVSLTFSPVENGSGNLIGASVVARLRSPKR